MSFKFSEHFAAKEYAEPRNAEEIPMRILHQTERIFLILVSLVQEGCSDI